MPVDVVRQDRFKAHIPAHAVEGRFDVFWRYLMPEEVLAYLIRPPSLLREPVESQIIRVLDVVEKFHFLEVIEDGSDLFFATETRQLYRELLAGMLALRLGAHYSLTITDSSWSRGGGAGSFRLCSALIA